MEIVRKKYIIYALRHKITGEVGYVGKTTDLPKRFSEHLNQSGIYKKPVKLSSQEQKKSGRKRFNNPRKIFWINANSESLEIVELESGYFSLHEIELKESFYINKYSSEGHLLTNSQDPGFNLSGIGRPFEKFPNGYRVLSKCSIDDYILIGRFLFSRDNFFRQYAKYISGKSDFSELADSYSEMTEIKGFAEANSQGRYVLFRGCGGMDRFERKRNLCSLMHGIESSSKSLSAACSAICAFSVASLGKIECLKRVELHDVESDLYLQSLKLTTLVLRKSNSETKIVLINCESGVIDRKTAKKQLQKIESKYHHSKNLIESFELKNISIENFIIKLNLELIQNIGITPEDLVF